MSLVFKRSSEIINVLKENVFLFNNLSIDLTSEVLDLFNKKTKSLKIIITPSN